MQMIKRYADARPGGDGARICFKALLVFAAIMAMSLFAAQGAQAGGYALSGVGSKAINMGGAFRGLADDWSAAYWNPAGLTQLDQSELNAMLVAISPKPQFNPNITLNGLDLGYRNGQVRYPNDKTHFFPDVSGFFKIKGLKGITAGLAIYVPYGLGSEWDLFDPINMDLANPFPWIDHKANVSIMDFHPTVAKAFMDNKLSLGAGISFERGSMTFQKTYLKPSGMPIPHENLIINSDMTGSGWGYGANIGILYKFSSKLQCGISAKTSSTLKLDGNAKQELSTFKDDDLRTILLSNSYTAAESAQIMFLFETNNHVANPKVKADFKTPADVGFGIAFKPSEKLTITGDFSYTNWSSIDKITLKLSGNDPTGSPAQNSVIMLNWDNTIRFSLGAEYWVAKPLALRLGYYFDQSPIPDKTFTPLIPDVGDKNSLNIGAAVKYSGLEFSYNFEYLAFKDRTIAASAYDDVNGDGYYDNYPGAFKSKLYASHVSLTYRF
jgi:long-chain fatty acid transport protein